MDQDEINNMRCCLCRNSVEVDIVAPTVKGCELSKHSLERKYSEENLLTRFL